MKIKPEHYAHIKSEIVNKAGSVADRRAAIVAEGRAKDVEKRVRWDMLYRAGLTSFICDTLYDYIDDTHIDTALKNIMKEIEV